MTTATRSPIAAGHSIVHRAGHATITLQNTGLTFTVTTYQGPTRIEAWCRAYETEAEARAAARHTARAFAKHGTDSAIDARQAELGAVVREQEHRMLRHMHNRAVLAVARAEADTLLDLHLLALLADEERARITAL